jgi:hypothetical protein
MNSKWYIYILISVLRRFNEVCKRSLVNEIKEVKSKTLILEWVLAVGIVEEMERIQGI